MISVYWVSFFLLADFYLMEIFPVLCGSGVLRCHVVFFVFLRFLFIFNQKKIQIFFLAFLFPSVRVHGGGKYFFKFFLFFWRPWPARPFCWFLRLRLFLLLFLVLVPFSFRSFTTFGRLVSISANVKEKEKKRKENSRPLALRASTVRLIDWFDWVLPSFTGFYLVLLGFT